MENRYTKKGYVRKIIVVLAMLMIFNFIYPYIPVYAEDTQEETIEEAPFGTLLKPLLNLISGLGEGIIWVIQNMMLGMGTSNAYVDVDNSDFFTAVAAVIGGVVGVVAGAAIIIGGAFLTLPSGGTSDAVAIPVGTTVVTASVTGIVGAFTAGNIAEKAFEDPFYLPLYQISPQEIFLNAIPALNVNFINPTTYDLEKEGVINSAKILQPEISKWYVSIRNLVLVALMVVLLYIGIRIVISSTAGEKAKYKEHIKDWLIAVILVLFMHYIMAFALTATEYVTSFLFFKNKQIRYELPEEVMEKAFPDDYEDYKNPDDGKYYFYTNLMGHVRLQQQMTDRDENGNQQFSWGFIGYTIIYLVLVIYTVMFLIIYLKRVIYMAFLTVIAPLVALTYPIDKISDGKSQAFDMWLKEYMFNLLLQPMHLLLYTILIGSVVELATENMIYAIVALGFLMTAEKLMRSFFGFNKADTTESVVGGVVGGSLAMGAINSLGRFNVPEQYGNYLEEGDNNEVANSSTAYSTKIRTPDVGVTTGDELILNAFGSENRNNENKQEVVFNKKRSFIRNAMGPSPTMQRRLERERIIEQERNTMNYIEENQNSGQQGTIETGGSNSNVNININGQNGNLRLTPSNNISNPEINIQGNSDNLSRTTNIRTTGQKAINEQTSLPNSINKNPQLNFKKVIAGAETGGKFIGKFVGKIATKAPRAITKGALGIAVGTAGIAAGVASGDLSNIATYGAGAAVVGSKLGDTVSNVASGAVEKAKGIPSGLKEAREDYYDNRFTGEERKKMRNEKLDKEWEKAKETVKLYKEKFGKDNYQEAMESAKEYRKHGITDDDSIIGAMKLQGLANQSATSDERIALAKAASTINSEGELKSYGDRMKELGIGEDKIKEINRNIRKIKDM